MLRQGYNHHIRTPPHIGEPTWGGESASAVTRSTLQRLHEQPLLAPGAGDGRHTQVRKVGSHASGSRSAADTWRGGRSRPRRGNQAGGNEAGRRSPIPETVQTEALSHRVRSSAGVTAKCVPKHTLISPLFFFFFRLGEDHQSHREG